MEEPRILYEDEHLVVVVKPYGVLSEDAASDKGAVRNNWVQTPDASEEGAVRNNRVQTSDVSEEGVVRNNWVQTLRNGSQVSLPAMLREHTGGMIYPVHRLDRTTRGVMVYAKTPSAAAALSEAVRNNRVQKEYSALVEGVTDESGELTDLLYYDRSRNKSFVVKRARRGVKEARLSYERIAAEEYAGAAVSRLRIRLMTGRTHQIRVQFASRKHPLVGDRRYGSRISADNIALCACGLCFPHPVTGEEMEFRIG